MTTVNMLEAKTNLSRLVEAVEKGEESEIIIARNGKPAAKLVPLDTKDAREPRRLGIADGQFGEFDYDEFQALDEVVWQGFHESAPATPKPRRKAPRK